MKAKNKYDHVWSGEYSGVTNEEQALEALLKIVCEIKNNGTGFINVISPETMRYAEEAIAKNGWRIEKTQSWVFGLEHHQCVKN